MRTAIITTLVIAALSGVVSAQCDNTTNTQEILDNFTAIYVDPPPYNEYVSSTRERISEVTMIIDILLIKTGAFIDCETGVIEVFINVPENLLPAEITFPDTFSGFNVTLIQSPVRMRA